MKIKDRIEKLKKKFGGDSNVKHLWDFEKHGERHPEWYVLMFGKYCYHQGRKDAKKGIGEQ